MNFLRFQPSQSQQLIRFYERVFSAAEGEAEGAIIAKLVTDLVTNTDPEELMGYLAIEQQSIRGAILFSRFTVPNAQLAYLMSPVAVATEAQRTGIGQALITHGLKQLQTQGVNLVFTYGDPAFYSKTGFMPLSETEIKAPYPLSQPIGWLGQSLDGNPIQPMQGATQCVAAFCDPSYW